MLFYKGLKHCIEISGCRACVYDFGLEETLSEISANLQAPKHQLPFQVRVFNKYSERGLQ